MITLLSHLFFFSFVQELMLCNSGEVLEKTPLLVFQTLIELINCIFRLEETSANYILDKNPIYE